MSDTGHLKCPRCGKELKASAPEGLCPACLGALNFATDTAFTGAETKEPLPTLTPAELAPQFPQLEILECLGRGGMGVVYKARQKSLNRLVALKLLAPERVQDAKFAARFEKEAQALAVLNHPNIVTVHDFGQAGGFYYLLMEFVDGVNLRQLLRSRKLQPSEALAIVPPVCEALQYAHEHGIVHRDIKPENLLLAKDGRVKIADFGIAKMLGSETSAASISLASSGGEGQGEQASAISATQQTTMGTPQYMAPEQLEHPQAADHRADIYSLGVVLYELLTGELPTDKLQPPSRKVQIDVRLDEIVLRALEKTPELRYQTAGEFKTQVEMVGEKGRDQELSAQEDITPAKSGPMPRELKLIAGWMMVQGGLALVNSIFAFISWGQIFLNLLVLHLLIGFGLLSLRVGWWRAAVAMNGIQLFASLVGVPLVLFVGATAGKMLSPWEAFRGQPVVLGAMVLIQCVLVTTCSLVHFTLMRLRREGWFGPVTRKHGTAGFPVMVVVFYAGVILGICFIGMLSFRFSRDSAYLLVVGIMAVVSPFVGVMTGNALRQAEQGKDQGGLERIKGRLKALSIVAWILALPVVGFAIFFFLAMLDERGKWNPTTSEAVIVPLTWLGAVLLPWAARRLGGAPQEELAGSVPSKGIRYKGAACICLLLSVGALNLATWQETRFSESAALLQDKNLKAVENLRHFSVSSMGSAKVEKIRARDAMNNPKAGAEAVAKATGEYDARSQFLHQLEQNLRDAESLGRQLAQPMPVMNPYLFAILMAAPWAILGFIILNAGLWLQDYRQSQKLWVFSAAVGGMLLSAVFFWVSHGREQGAWLRENERMLLRSQNRLGALPKVQPVAEAALKQLDVSRDSKAENILTTGKYPGDWIWEANSETLNRVPPMFLLRESMLPKDWIPFDMFGKDRYLARGKTLQELMAAAWSQKDSSMRIVLETGPAETRFDFIVTNDSKWWETLRVELIRRFNLSEEKVADSNGMIIRYKRTVEDINQASNQTKVGVPVKAMPSQPAAVSPRQVGPTRSTTVQVPTKFIFPVWLILGVLVLGGLFIGGVVLMVWLARKNGLKGCLFAGVVVGGLILVVGIVAVVVFWSYSVKEIRQGFQPIATLELSSINPTSPPAAPNGLAMQVQNGLNLKVPPGALVTFEVFIRHGDDHREPVPSLTAVVATDEGDGINTWLSWMGKREDDGQGTNQLWSWSVNGNVLGTVPMPNRTDYGTNMAWQVKPREVLNWWQLAMPKSLTMNAGSIQEIALFRTFGSATTDAAQPKEIIARIKRQALPEEMKMQVGQYKMLLGLEAFEKVNAWNRKAGMGEKRTVENPVPTPLVSQEMVEQARKDYENAKLLMEAGRTTLNEWVDAETHLKWAEAMHKGDARAALEVKRDGAAKKYERVKLLAGDRLPRTELAKLARELAEAEAALKQFDLKEAK